MGAGRGQLDYGRVIAGEHVTHADARVPFASSRNSTSIPPSFIACVTRDAGLLLTGLSSHIYFYSRSTRGVPGCAALLVVRGSQQHVQEVHQEGRARRRAQWQWPTSRLLAGARRQKGGSCSETAAEGGSGGKGRSGSMRAEAALAAVGIGTRQCIRAGQWAAGGGAEGIRAAANPNSRARSAVRTVHTR